MARVAFERSPPKGMSAVLKPEDDEPGLFEPEDEEPEPEPEPELPGPYWPPGPYCAFAREAMDEVVRSGT